MSRVQEVSQLLKDGQNLLEIKSSFSLTLYSILDYLRRAVGNGYISRADIFFAIPRRHRALFYLYQTYDGTPIYTVIKSHAANVAAPGLSAIIQQQVEDVSRNLADTYNVSLAELPWKDWDSELYSAYLEFSNIEYLRSDLYWEIATLEVTFNRFLRDVLIKTYGEGDDGWWRKGIKTDLRAELVSIREKDDEPAADAFCYLTFINIKEILKKPNWEIFTRYFSKEIGKNQEKYLKSLTRINSIRNQVMHPIKNGKHTYSDFELVRNTLRGLESAVKKFKDVG